MKTKILLLAFFAIAGISQAQIVSIPDTNFKAKLLSASTTNQVAKSIYGSYFKIDANNDSQIQTIEASLVAELNLTSADISSLEGISSFSALIRLDCTSNLLNTLDLNTPSTLQRLKLDNNPISSLNLSGLTSLTDLSLANCGLTTMNTINLSGLTALSDLYIQNNSLTELDVTSFPALSTLFCSYNQLTILNINGLTSLLTLNCANNQLTSISFSGVPNLSRLYCYNNNLTSLNLSGVLRFYNFDCSHNQLTSLDLSNITFIDYFDCSYNQLQELDLIKIGVSQITLPNYNVSNNNLIRLSANHKQVNVNFSNNPALQYLCCDKLSVTQFQQKAMENGNYTCEVNTYCSLDPLIGSLFQSYNTWQICMESKKVFGSNKYDFNNNGYDENDIIVPNLKFNVKYNYYGTFNLGSVIANTTGNYDISSTKQWKNAGFYFVPELENPTYFTFSPALSPIAFDTNQTQNFTLTANGVNSDLEVVVEPMNKAIPGNTVSYKVFYRNKGTNTQSGTVQLTFDSNVLSFTEATPSISSQNSNTLSWNFVDLAPFGSGVITLNFNLNDSSSTNPVNVGDILPFTGTIASENTDITPLDNSLLLKQKVVNSSSSNNIICLQGDVVSNDFIGNFLYFTVYFQNTGTTNATNLVIKNVFNANQFDKDSIIPIDSSHPFITRVEGGIVDFIFENINLPFASGMNQGFVTFKIKTQSTLSPIIDSNALQMPNDTTISHFASIYFDGRPPILTNTASIVITTLDNQSFDFSNYFVLYPNPTSDILKIENTKNIAINSVKIYNLLGQLLKEVKDETLIKIDVSHLELGNYLIVVDTEKGKKVAQFIKK